MRSRDETNLLHNEMTKSTCVVKFICITLSGGFETFHHHFKKNDFCMKIKCFTCCKSLKKSKSFANRLAKKFARSFCIDFYRKFCRNNIGIFSNLFEFLKLSKHVCNKNFHQFVNSLCSWRLLLNQICVKEKILPGLYHWRNG